MKYHKYDRAYLTQRELEIIETTEFKADRLERIKDCFLFSCYTGLSYVDAKELTKDHLVRGIDNRIWLFTKREKTQELVKIPLLPKAWEILEKYLESPENETTGKILPICSNQKTNKYIREIAESCGIRKHLTFHVARHTFATTVMLTNGVPIETVSKLLGHTKLSTTQIYARVIDTKISEDMDNLMERIEGKKGKVGMK
ncbi:site-specific integrase [Robertkochia solimangrovi]|uniref:site-specific integrase n=1 Tax=Robertkochia solimangrovi TaxID=2213046 RepID=UPI00117C983D|nr:hypothetical protein DMZ48_13380 [Robertkochia solimangrovi]